MNPAIILAVGEVVKRVVDHKKIASKTNASTAVAATGGTAAFITMVQSDDPMIQIIGAIAIAACGALAMYKENKDKKK